MMGWWGDVGGVVAHEILVSAQGPLVLGFRAKGLAPGLDNLILCFVLLYHVSSTVCKGIKETVPKLPSCGKSNLPIFVGVVVRVLALGTDFVFQSLL